MEDPLSEVPVLGDTFAGDSFAHAQDDGAVAPSPASASNNAELSASSVHEAAAASPVPPTASLPTPNSASVSAAKPRGFSPNVPVSALQSAKPASLERTISLTDEPLDSPPRFQTVAATSTSASASRGGLSAPPGGWGAASVGAADAAPSYDEVVASGSNSGTSPPQLPPPSYADSVYFDRAEITPQEDSGGSSTVVTDDGALAAAGSLTVAVTSPEKRTDSSSALGRLAGKKYVAFAVAYRAEGLPAFTAAPAGAPRRRFRDFVGLAARLAVSHRGYFIPPRPEKKLEGQLDASPEFIEERRDSLDKWMRQLAAHPALRVAPATVAFLTTAGDLDTDPAWFALAGSDSVASLSPVGSLARGVEPPAPSRRASGGAEHLVRALKELGTSVALAATPGAASAGGGVRENDAAFLAAKARAAALERQLADASAAAERLVGRAAAACDALGDAGLALVRLSKSEEAEGVRRGRLEPRGAAQRLAAADARGAGAAAVRACRLGRAAAGQLAAQLAPLHAHLAMAPAVTRAAADRADALLTWQTLAAEADAKRAKTARVQAEPLKAGGPFGLGATTPASKSAALDTLAKQTESVDAATAAAAAQYAAICARNASEFARLDAQRTADFAGMAQGFAHVAAAAGERAVVIWSPLAEGLTLRGVGAGPAPPEEDDTVLAAETMAQGERATLSAAAGAADSD